MDNLLLAGPVCKSLFHPQLKHRFYAGTPPFKRLNTNNLNKCFYWEKVSYAQILSTPVITALTELLLYIFILLLIIGEVVIWGVEKPDGYPQEVYTGELISSVSIY
ncbi:hypothetical protein [Halomonas sp. GFAJ-1]|uniref:hypothetical protein n=1 Tax=Halomonas sp. GFAJ-1 TaxID=1118153 RepID=UPI00054E8AFD|nr:hypothetical protein [Halomonas sp. GFAJ-1]AVI61917.1 hypothetical protein BB497_03980 [Halomonas sp. GFAJ-1]